MEGLELQVVGPQPMLSNPVVMEEAGGDPHGNKIVAIVGHEWDDSCDRWVCKVEWKQGGQG